jgi:hypothetical protein
VQFFPDQLLILQILSMVHRGFTAGNWRARSAVHHLLLLENRRAIFPCQRISW